MSILLHGDCLEEMKGLDDDSIDLIFCDLPYNQTSCVWDQAVLDLEQFWIEVMRIKKLHTPIFMTTTTKFGLSLLNSCPKKCPFRYDIVWVKSAPAGFLCVSTNSSISVKDKGDIKIKDVKINDYVKSKNGFIKVLDYFDNGKKECFKIITNNNLELILTKDHKIETKTGLKPLEEINIYNKELILTDDGFDYIKKIEYVGLNDTCDIEVEHTDHTYYCNNISISNCAKKMPMRKHEMIYVFYEKLPFYDLSSHQHKFIKEDKGTINSKIYDIPNKDKGGMYRSPAGQYEPPLPNSIVKEPEPEATTGKEDIYGNPNRDIEDYKKCGKKGKNQVLYDPPLPNSVVKEEETECKYVGKPVMRENTTYGDVISYEIKERKNGESRYDPPLPTSVVKEEIKYDQECNSELYGNVKRDDRKNKIVYDPPLPNSVVKEEQDKGEEETQEGIYGTLPKTDKGTDAHSAQYDPPLPTSMLEVKSTRGKHSTEKPVALMSWILKYYSKEGDVILDPTMGSGSTGVACKNMNRNFIGIEMDAEIYEGAVNRIEE